MTPANDDDNVARLEQDSSALVSELQVQIAQLRNDIAAIARSISDAGSAKLNDAMDGAAEIGSEARAKVKGAVSRAEEELGALERQTCDYVRERPLKALCLAAVVGGALALLLKR